MLVWLGVLGIAFTAIAVISGESLGVMWTSHTRVVAAAGQEGTGPSGLRFNLSELSDHLETLAPAVVGLLAIAWRWRRRTDLDSSGPLTPALSPSTGEREPRHRSLGEGWSEGVARGWRHMAFPLVFLGTCLVVHLLHRPVLGLLLPAFSHSDGVDRRLRVLRVRRSGAFRHRYGDRQGADRWFCGSGGWASVRG